MYSTCAEKKNTKKERLIVSGLLPKRKKYRSICIQENKYTKHLCPASKSPAVAFSFDFNAIGTNI